MSQQDDKIKVDLNSKQADEPKKDELPANLKKKPPKAAAAVCAAVKAV